MSGWGAVTGMLRVHAADVQMHGRRRRQTPEHLPLNYTRVATAVQKGRQFLCDLKLSILFF